MQKSIANILDSCLFDMDFFLLDILFEFLVKRCIFDFALKTASDSADSEVKFSPPPGCQDREES